MTAARPTGRWRGVVALPLLAGAAGALFARPSLLLLSVVGIAYAVYPRVTGISPSDVDVRVDRSLDAADPDRGETVEVTVTARNAGDRTLPDLRFVDGVPSSLPVTDGRPRHATALRPGETTSFSYSVAVERGAHRFEPTRVVARDLSGATEVETTAGRGSVVEWAADAAATPLRERTRVESGRIASGDTGSGLEFHHVRRYRRGDPQSRIDWRRFARTGELSTVEFRLERAPSVVFCLDARPPAYRSNGADAVASGVDAIRRMHAGLRSTNAYVGLAVLGRGEWVPPGGGADHDARVRAATEAVPDRPAVGDGGESGGPDAQLRLLDDRLSADAQVVFVSPMVDEFALEAASTLEAAGHAVTAVSPNVTATESLGERLADVERERRLRSLRRTGTRVVDWSPSEPLERAIARARRGWSA